MQTHCFYTVWPFLGGGGAIVMVAIMLLTDTFRSNIAVSRWRDAVWLAWLAAPLYWIHQLEEYSLPLLGFDYNLPDMVAKNIGFPPYPECPVPMVFYPVVNIALMWFGAPLAAYLCKRNLVLGFSYWGLIFANGLVHTMGSSDPAGSTEKCMRSRPQIAVDDVLRMANSAGNADRHAPSIGTDRMRWSLPVGTRTVLPIETRRPTISSARPPTHECFKGGECRLLPWPGGRDAEVFVCTRRVGQAFARFAIALGKAR